MLDRQEEGGILDRPLLGHFGGFRKRTALVLMMGLCVAGCQYEGAQEAATSKGTTSNVTAAEPKTPNISVRGPVKPVPEVNICDEKVKTDANISKYPRAPRKNIQKILDKFKGAETAIESFTGNGCRDTIIFIPKGFDKRKPIELQYHFHGSFSNFIGMPVPYDTKLVRKGGYSKADMRLEQALIALNYQHKLERRNTILVYPLSAGRRLQGEEYAYNFAYDDLWMKAGNDTDDSMTVLDFDVRNKLVSDLGINADEATITLSGHSAGGKPIMHAIQSGFVPDKIKFLEASYRDWAEKTYKKLHDDGHNIPIEVRYKPGHETERSAHALYSGENVRVIANSKLTHGQFVELL